jgi:hypothetical protein
VKREVFLLPALHNLCFLGTVPLRLPGWGSFPEV